MSKQRVFLTGATGGMGLASLKEMRRTPINRTL